MPTGEMSVGPWMTDLIWYRAAKSSSLLEDGGEVASSAGSGMRCAGL
jgi:hypothetical protein